MSHDNDARDFQSSSHLTLQVDCFFFFRLQYLHSDTVKPKIIHRDIKPENVLLDESNTARLSDFGMSHVGDGGSRPQREV